MTYFETLGVERQYSAANIKIAKKALATSCDICTKTGKHIQCDKCAIASVHNDILCILTK